MKFLNLFIDESGLANPKSKDSPCYILCGCIVNEENRNFLKIQADQIKFKYWNKTDIVFHSREIGRKIGEFKNLKDPKIWREFQGDLFHFLSVGGFQVFIVIIDKMKATGKNWNEIKVYKESANIMVKNFVLSLLAFQKNKGRLVVESATSQKDFIYHKAAGYFLSNGIKELKIPYTDIQNVLTEISFVTKKNCDIEEQIADLMTYAAKLKFLGNKVSDSTSYEQKIVKILEGKLFSVNPNTGEKKKKFHSKIESYKILP